MVIGALEIQMYADIARLKSDLDQAKSVVGSSMKSITDAVELAQKALIAFAGIASVDAFASMVRNNITAAASLGKLATQAGVTVEAMSGLVGVGKLSGTAAETVAAAMNKMTKAMSGTTEEGKGAGAALRALGLNFDDFQKLSPDERMLVTAKAMDKFQDGSGKSAVAMALMGKSGAEMLPYLKDLAENGQLNAKVTAEQAAMAKDFNNNLNRLTLSSEAWKKELSMGMLPALDDASTAFLGVMNSTGGLRDGIKKLSQDGTIDSYVRSAVTVLTYFADIIELVVRAVKIMGEGIGAYIALIINQFNGLGAAIKLAMSGEFSAAGDALKTGFQQSKDIVMDYGKSIIDTFGADTMGKKFRDRMEDVKGLAAATAKAKAEANSLKEKLPDDFNQKLGGGKSGAAKVDPEIKRAYDEAIAQQKSYADEAKFINSELIKDIDSINKRGLISEYDYHAKKDEAALKGIDDQKAIVGKEIAIAVASKLPLLERQKAIEAFNKTLQDLNQAKRAINAESIRQEEEANAKVGAVMDKRLEDMLRGTKALVDEQKTLRQQREEFGLTEQQLNALQIARADEMATALERQAVTRDGIDLTGAESEELRKQAALIRENAKYRIENTGIKEIQSQWKTFYGDIERGLTDSLFRAFESGKGFFKTLWDGIKNLFKTTVLKLVVQGVAGAAGLGGAGASLAQQALGATGAAGGTLGGASSLMSGVNAATGAFGASAMSTGMGVWGGLGELSSLGIGEALSTGFAAVTSGTLAGLSGGLGAIAGALGPIALGAVALYSLFGNKESASKSTGDLQRRYGADGAVTSESSRFGIGNGAQVIDGLYSQLSSLQKLLGAKGAVDFGYGAYSGNGNKNPMGAISAAGFNSGEVPTAELGLAASRAILAGLQASEMPAGIAKIINSINPATASAEQIKALETNAATYAQSIKSIIDAIEGSPLNSLKGMAFETADALVVAAGGLDNFNNSLKSYYDNFYSAEEKRVQTVAEITKKLNAAGAGLTTEQVSGMSRADFRAKFEGANSLELNAALLSVAGAFASITPEATAAAAGIAAVSTAISDTLKGLLKDRASLEADLMQAQGNTGGADTARRAIAVTGYSEAEKAAYDYNQALREQIKTTQDASAALATSQAAAQAAAQATAAERKTLQDQLNALTDTAAQALTRQRDALSESNKGLFDQVQAATEAKSANAALAQSQQAQADAAKAAADKLAGINAGLQDKLDLLTGAQTQRSLELRAATDDSTKSLLNQIYAQEDLKAATGSMSQAAGGAASAFVAAAEKIASQRQNLEQQLFELTATDTQKAAKSREAIDPANLDVYDKVVAAQRAAKDATDKVTRATEQATAAAATYAAQMARFGSSFNLRFDLTTASNALKTSISTALSFALSNAVANVARTSIVTAPGSLTGPDDITATFISQRDSVLQNTQNVLTSTNNAITQARALRSFFTGLTSQAIKLEKEISDANTAIGKGVQAINVAKYFTDFATDLNAAFGTIKSVLDTGAATLADSQGILDFTAGGTARNTDRSTTRIQGLLNSIGADLTAFTASGLETLVTSVGGGATKIGAAITKNILDSISTSIKDNAAFKDLSTASLGYVGSIVGGVGKGDVQGINDAFVLLSGALSSGKINATQYDVAIGLVTDAFSVGAAAAGTAAESVADAYKRLTTVLKTNEQIAQERISLESRLYAASDNEVVAAIRARNAIDSLNLVLYDSVLAAEKTKTILQERSGLETQLAALTDTASQALERQRAALDISNQGLFDQIRALNASKKVDEERAGLQSQLNGLTDTAAEALTRQRNALNVTNQALFDQVQAQVKANAAATERISLEARLNAATDTTAQALTRARNAIDPLNRALFDTVTAAEAAKTAQAEATAAAQAVAAERKGLQDQLNSLTDTSTQALTRQRDALNESNRALFDQVQAQTKANAISAERKGLQDQLNGLTDTSTQALTRQRDALNESNRALFDQIQTQTKANAIAAERKTLQDQLNSLTDTSAQALTRQRNALDASNRALFDQIQAVTAANAAVEAAKASAATAANAVSEAFNQVTKAANAQKAALTTTYEELTKGINAQLSTVGDSVSKLQSLSSKLKSSLDGMQILGSEGASRAGGQQTIAEILASVRAGGALPVNSRELDNALSVVAKPSEQLFASFTEYAKDFYSTANDISSLERLTDKELTAQQVQQATLSAQLAIAKASHESQVKGINDTLAIAQAQLDEFQQNNTAILSLNDAVALFSNNITEAIKAQTAAQAAQAATAAAATAQAATAAQAAAAVRTATGTNTGTGTSTGTKIQGSQPTMAEQYGEYGAFKEIALRVGVNQRLNEISNASGAVTNQQRIDIAKEYGATLTQVEDLGKVARLPGFAVGTNYVPRDMLAQIHKGETIIPAFDSQQFRNESGGNNKEMVTELRELKQELKQLRASQERNTEYSKISADRLDGRQGVPFLVQVAS